MFRFNFTEAEAAIKVGGKITGKVEGNKVCCRRARKGERCDVDEVRKSKSRP